MELESVIGKEMTQAEVRDMLNALHEENEQLKSDNKCYVKRYSELFDDYIDCKKENEQLKQSNQKLNDELQETMGYLALKSGVEKENEQLKTDKMILEHNHLPVMERKIKKYKMNVDALTETNDLLNEKIETLSDENEQLKQRNDRQYQQLNKLWKLIEKGDWETLTAMDKKMKEDEERLRNEWKCYE